MGLPPSEQQQQTLDEVLGYLNFSSGATDPRFLRQLNECFGWLTGESTGGGTSVEIRDSDRQPTWRQVWSLLESRIDSWQATSPSFSDVSQVRSVLVLIREHFVPAYLEFHRDLLFHQPEEFLFGPLMMGRVCEMVIRQGAPWDDTQRITQATMAALQDYIGYRPVAVLESQKTEPYPHEWVRPVPIYIQHAGVAYGPYRALIEQALSILGQTDRRILRECDFDSECLTELSIDPRAYDFDHPVHKRPNYQFGQWDPHALDPRGRYFRFVLQQVTLDSLLRRVEEASAELREEYLIEAASVLVGTILMAAGVSGGHPGAHDSETTLAILVARIAQYRDQFYAEIVTHMEPAHAERLRREAEERQQPFGGARQHLNAALARQRATQMGLAQLAKVFVTMGYSDTAWRQLQQVPVTATRMRCQIECCLTAGHRDLKANRSAEALQQGEAAWDLLQRGIHCGAFVDPWNILGFDGNFSLFPAMENSVHDWRIDDLVNLIERIFSLYLRIWCRAAALHQEEIRRTVDARFMRAAHWWHQFAAHEVSCVDSESALDWYEAGRHVAQALGAWHEAGAAAGDVAFWVPHVEVFDSSKAYAMVIETLLDHHDYVASRALLVHWISHEGKVPLQSGRISFRPLAQRWLRDLCTHCSANHERRTNETDVPLRRYSDPLPLIRKFFDFLEANSGIYWHVPQFDLGFEVHDDDELDSDEAAGEEELEEDDRFAAAYEDVVYRDSTADGIEGSVFSTDSTSDVEWEDMSQEIGARLDFLSCQADLWRQAVHGIFVHHWQSSSEVLPSPAPMAPALSDVEMDALRQWSEQADQKLRDGWRLIEQIEAHHIGRTGNDMVATMQADRQRMLKDSLLGQAIDLCVALADARDWLKAGLASARPEPVVESSTDDAYWSVVLLSLVLRGDPGPIRELWPIFLNSLQGKGVLYVSPVRGGVGTDIWQIRIRQRRLQRLLALLPRLGLIRETCDLMDTVRELERAVPAGPSAVSEYDRIFDIGFRSLLDATVAASAEPSHSSSPQDDDNPDVTLIACLERISEAMLITWLSHSRTLRLSALERIQSNDDWERLVAFVEEYGADLFTQGFFHPSRMRAILHQGVQNWLKETKQQEGADLPRLFDQLDQEIPLRDAARHLTIILEAMVANYPEYRDYNTTTTQSDRGELLYTLLDFLRLRTSYDRVAWNLRPVITVHEVLLRAGRDEAAQLWRNALSRRVSDEAERFLHRLKRLQRKYSMQMPTVADRLSERFVRPLQVDRLRSLVRLSIHDSPNQDPRPALVILEEEARLLLDELGGVGFDVPEWLILLEEEAQQANGEKTASNAELPDQLVPPIRLSLDEIMDQIHRWQQGGDDPAESV